jgi:exonuclease SbcC
MFEIEYSYKRGGPLYQKKYSSSSNVFILEGENDTGKTTVLQMIALGLYGDQVTSIDESLKKKMLRLLDPATEIASFRFSIRSPDGETLISELKNGKVSLYINGKLSPPDSIKERFQLIFDVPGEPFGKLVGALRPLEEKIFQWDGYVERYVRQLTSIQEELRQYKERERRIQELKKELNQLEENKRDLKDLLNSAQENLEKFRKAQIVATFENLQAEREKLRATLNEVRKKLLKLKKARGLTPKGRELINDFNFTFFCFQHLSPSEGILSVLPDADKVKFRKVEEEIKNTSRHNLTPEKIRHWFSLFMQFRNRIEQIEKEKNLTVQRDILHFLSQLTQLLSQFPHFVIPLPSGEIKASELLKAIDTYRQRIIQESLAFKVGEALKQIDEKLQLLKRIEELRQKIPQIPEETWEDLQSRQLRIASDLAKVEQRLGEIYSEYMKIPSEEKEMLKQIPWSEEEIKRIEERYKLYNEKIQEIESKILERKESLKFYEGLKQPKIQISEEELEREIELCRSIRRKIEDFREFIGGMLSSQPIKGMEQYYDIVGEYLAQILEEVYFEHRSWKVKKVDMQKGCYVVEGREKPISFVDLGTGHSKLDAFLSVLRQETGKKKIVLLDEVGDMDESVFDRLLEELKKQAREGKILLAALTRVGEGQPKIIEIPV